MYETLKQRRDFLSAAKGAYQSMPSVVVQIRKREDENPPRVGFTCTKKLGNAVVRNRIRRRLKEAVRVHSHEFLLPGHDYVLVGRSLTATQGFEALQKDIISALDRLHTGRGRAAKERPTKKT